MARATLSELAEANELQRGFAALTRGAQRRAFARAAAASHAAMCALSPVPDDVAAMDDAALLAELGA